MKEDLKTLLKVAKMINYKKYNELYASIDLVVYDKEDIENSQKSKIINMVGTALTISLIIVGFRCITAKDMIFYFVRKPFETCKNEVVKYIAKPFVLCTTCMASVHTLVWFPFVVGSYNWSIIPVALMVAFFNTLLYLLVETLDKYSKVKKKNKNNR